MAFANGDILQIMAVGSYDGQVIRNVFHYRVSGFTGDVTPGEVIDEFQQEVLSVIITMQNTSFVWNLVRLDNLTDGVTFGEESFSLSGLVGGDTFLPAFFASAYRLDRLTKITRVGWKRFCGLSEGMVNGNVPASTFDDEVAAIEEVLAEPQSVTGGAGSLDILPIILGRTETGEYDLARYSNVTGASWVRWTSQASRRRGRGE